MEAGCTLVHREVDTEEDYFTAEDLIVIKDVSGTEYGTRLRDYSQRGCAR